MRSWPCSPRSGSTRRRIWLVTIAALVACGGGVGSEAAAQPALEGTEWRLVRLASGPVAAGDAQRAPSLTLEAEDARAFGSGGCNRFSGGYTREGQSLRFTPLAATKMACPDMEMESAYFAALDATRGWRLAAGGLELLDEAGAVVAGFAPAPAAAPAGAP
jgi:heat shock protein HslJ